MKSPQTPTSLFICEILTLLTPSLVSSMFLPALLSSQAEYLFWSSSPAHDLSDCYSEILSCTPILCCLSHAPRITHLRTVKCVQLNTLTQCIMCAINKILCWTSYFKHSHNRGTKKNSRIILFYIAH